jgi:hypothetical protein
MINHLELIINPYITPVYTSATNIVSPISTIKLEDLYEAFLTFINILQIGLETLWFIMKEGITEILANITNTTNIKKFIYIICIYNLFMLFFIDNQRKKFIEQKKQMYQLEKQVDYLNSVAEKMDKDVEEEWIEEIEEIIKNYNKETNKKINMIKRKIKKIEDELNCY